MFYFIEAGIVALRCKHFCVEIGMHIRLYFSVLNFWHIMHVTNSVIPESGNLVISCRVQKLCKVYKLYLKCILFVVHREGKYLSLVMYIRFYSNISS